MQGTKEDMSNNVHEDQAVAAWLDESQAKIWGTYMQVQLRLNYEMNRQLQNDYGLSLADYHVLSALSEAPGGRLQLSALATLVGWELSRLSHHTRRMGERNFVKRRPSTSDGRATDIQLTDVGWEAVAKAAPAHVALVRRLFFEGLTHDSEVDLQTALDSIYQSVVENGTLAKPS
jgi:DNA-binding MarR family transcriptional regulator